VASIASRRVFRARHGDAVAPHIRREVLNKVSTGRKIGRD
jgi:hypothetical protein